jgi:hypothetical protein
MADPYHHAVSSSRKNGGTPEDYVAIHQWFDETKALMVDVRHRALRHHAEGIALAIRIFGPTITLSTCKHCGLTEGKHPVGDTGMFAPRACATFTPKIVPTRYIGEQHVREDLGFVPKASEWLELIEPQPWMQNARRLSRELEAEVEVPGR